MYEYLTLKDLGVIIIFLIVVIVGIYLIRLLKNLGDVVSGLKKLLGDNQKQIDKVIKDIPALTENAVSITADIKELMAFAKDEKKTIDNVLENIREIVAIITLTVKEVNDSVFLKLKGIISFLAILIKMLQKKVKTDDTDEQERNAAPKKKAKNAADPAAEDVKPVQKTESEGRVPKEAGKAAKK